MSITRPDARELEPADWEAPGHTLAIWLAAEGADERDEEGKRLIAHTALLLLNGGWKPEIFQLPRPPRPGRWILRMDTAGPAPPHPQEGTRHELRAHSLALFEWQDYA